MTRRRSTRRRWPGRPLPFPGAEGGAARPVAGGNGRVTGGRSVGDWRPPHLQGPQTPIAGPLHVLKQERQLSAGEGTVRGARHHRPLQEWAPSRRPGTPLPCRNGHCWGPGHPLHGKSGHCQRIRHQSPLQEWTLLGHPAPPSSAGVDTVVGPGTPLSCRSGHCRAPSTPHLQEWTPLRDPAHPSPAGVGTVRGPGTPPPSPHWGQNARTSTHCGCRIPRLRSCLSGVLNKHPRKDQGNREGRGQSGWQGSRHPHKTILAPFSPQIRLEF